MTYKWLIWRQVSDVKADYEREASLLPLAYSFAYAHIVPTIWLRKIRYLVCKEQGVKNCKAKAKIIGEQFTLYKSHNHPVDDRLGLVYRFNEALFTAVTSSLRSFRVLYDEVCVADPDGAAQVPFATAQQSMLRWRSNICPSIPRSWEHYTQLLEMDQWQTFTTYNGGRLTVTTVRSADGSVAVVYGDIDFLRSLNPVHIYVDATFRVCPRTPKVLQFLTILAQIDDVILPIAWALMERKTKQSYVAVLHHFSTVLAPHIRPSTFMTDFEKALADALQTIYPAASAQRCFFHYCQALTKRVKKLRLLPLIRECANRGIVLRKLMALALLPAEDIYPAFRWIVSSATPDITRHFDRLFRYFETYWIQRVTPAVLSVFGMPCKTNNAAEAYHRVLGIRMGVHPSIWQFTAHLRDLQAVVRSSLASLDSALAITRPSQERQIAQPRTVEQAWQFYQERLLDIPRFLACASHFLKAFNNEVLIAAADQVQHFVDANLNVAERNNVQDLRVLFLEENLDDIRILHRQLPDADNEIIILPELVFQRCGLCRENSMDTISLPCCHWYACAGCTRTIIELARTINGDVRCAICGEVAAGFHTLIIVHQ